MHCDVLIIGAGIAGASAAYALQEVAPAVRIIIAEREDAPGYHSTGRSAAFFVETYGAPIVRALTRASRRFLESPPPGFADHPVLTHRSVLHIAREDQRASAERLFAECQGLTPDLEIVEGARLAALQPALRPGYAVCAVYEPYGQDMDVHALHQAYLRGALRAGGALLTRAEVRGLERRGEGWRVDTAAGSIEAGQVINAAGAWADEIARLAGLAPLGLAPKRRTVITFDPPAGTDIRRWPLTVDADEQFYFRPEAGRILASPGDETPMPPCDVQPEEVDIALAVARIERATTLCIERISHKWAGLRSFFPDRAPAVGPDPREPHFLWLAGQGGFGIMTSRAMGRLAAALATGGPLPGEVAAAGVTAEDLAPDRFVGGGPPAD